MTAAASQLWLGANERNTEARFTADSSEWYTPWDIVESAREALGGRIDLDPASCELANGHIGASRIFSLKNGHDGLVERWSGSVFCNPPSPPRPWWEWLMNQCPSAECPHAVFVAYSIECMQQSQGWSASMLRFPICIPRTRVRYLCTAAARARAIRKALAKRAAKSPSAGPTRAELRALDELDAMEPEQLVQGDAPPHASAIVGVGIDTATFRRAFGQIGEVCGG